MVVTLRNLSERINEQIENKDKSEKLKLCNFKFVHSVVCNAIIAINNSK